MTMTDQHLWEWLPDLHYYPTRPSTYGADPHQPSPQLASEYHMQAALKGGWKPKLKLKPPARPARKTRKRRKR